MAWLNNIGRIIKKKPKADGTPGGHFMVFERRKDKDKNYIGENPFPLVVNEGDIFQLRPKSEDLANLVKGGQITQQTADKICETVRFEINKAPADGKKGGEEKPTGKKDEVNF